MLSYLIVCTIIILILYHVTLDSITFVYLPLSLSIAISLIFVYGIFYSITLCYIYVSIYIYRSLYLYYIGQNINIILRFVVIYIYNRTIIPLFHKYAISIPFESPWNPPLFGHPSFFGSPVTLNWSSSCDARCHFCAMALLLTARLVLSTPGNTWKLCRAVPIRRVMNYLSIFFGLAMLSIFYICYIYIWLCMVICNVM